MLVMHDRRLWDAKVCTNKGGLPIHGDVGGTPELALNPLEGLEVQLRAALLVGACVCVSSQEMQEIARFLQRKQAL